MDSAIFQIIDPQNESVVKEYNLEYADAKELKQMFDEARQVWDEYLVSVETKSFSMSYSCTYKDQLMQELAKG